MNSLLVSKEKVEVTKMGKSKTEGDKYGSKKKKKGGGCEWKMPCSSVS